MNSQKRILVTPLDWGLGHATRCVPIIKYLVSRNIEVVIAASGRSLELLRKDFSGCEFIEIPGYNVTYISGNVSLDILKQSPEVLRKIKAENLWLAENISSLKIDAIISDNRYGMYHSSLPCVLITHQLNIPGPMLAKPLMKSKVKSWLKNFDHCWVPDYESETNLSGKLSHDGIQGKTIRYIGPLSRLKRAEQKAEFKYRYLGLVSGPENQRTIFEEKLLHIFKQTNEKCLIVCAKPDEEFLVEDENITLISHLSAEGLSKAISESEIIVCRSGYSTIMDLAELERSAIIVPTPGQPEQEYLAEYLSEGGLFLSLKQNKLDLETLQSSIIPKAFKFGRHSFEDVLEEFVLAIG